MKTMFIRTERLFLRPGWIEDAPELARAIAHEPVVRMLARAPWPYGEAEARAFLTTEQPFDLPNLLVTLPTERGRIIGGCGLHIGIRGEVELGYWITPECWGQGYAREAVAGLLAAARAMGHGRIVARHTLDNPASGKVLRANGFCPTGRTNRFRSLSRREDVCAVEYALEMEGAFRAFKSRPCAPVPELGAAA